MKSICLVASLLVLQLIAAGSATAVAIVDTGPGAAGNPPWVLNFSQFLAAEFSTSSPSVVNQVQGWISLAEVGATATAVIYAGGGDVPGLELFSAAFILNATGPDWFGPAGLDWALAPGTYWVAFEVRAGQTLDGAMPFPSASPLGNEAFTSSGTAYSGLDSLDIGVRIFGDIAQVQEPASVQLLLAGLLGLVLNHRRRVASSCKRAITKVIVTRHGATAARG